MIVSRKALFAKYGGRCAYCGRPITLRAMHRDHVVPLRRYKGVRYSFSGRHGCVNPDAHNAANIVACCRSCNLDKGALDLDTWRCSLRWVGWRDGLVFWFERYGAGNSDKNKIK